MNKRIRNTTLYIFCILALFGTSSCTTHDDTNELDAFKQAIRAKYDLKEQAFANNDPEPILQQFYTEEHSAVRGRHTHFRHRRITPTGMRKLSAKMSELRSFHTYV